MSVQKPQQQPIKVPPKPAQQQPAPKPAQQQQPAKAAQDPGDEQFVVIQLSPYAW